MSADPILRPEDVLLDAGPLPVRCDCCGKPVRDPYVLDHFQGRRQRVCGVCLERICRGVAQAERAAAERAAA